MNNLINFRDLGGTKTLDGKKLKNNKLLRAAKPVNLSDDELAKLREHNLSHIVDFRTKAETNNDAVTKIDDVLYTNLDVAADSKKSIANPKNWFKDFANTETAEKEFANTYREFVTIASAQKAYREFLKICANTNDGAILFHCTAGKDRTGFAAAILLKLLGVSTEDIYKDYIKTNDSKNEIANIAAKILPISDLTKPQLDALDVTLSAMPIFLDAAFETINTEYGSFENYLELALGIGSEDISCIKNLYLE